MKKLINPNFIDAGVVNFVSAHKTEIQAYLTNNAASEFVTFDKIRADFPALAAQLTDGMIEEICKALNLPVTEG